MATLALPPAVSAHAMKLALVHDLAEALVGDITPHDGVSTEEKERRERAAMATVRDEVLGGDGVAGGGALGAHLVALWEEYEAGETEAAALVKDVDKHEMIVQAFEYEGCTFVGFVFFCSRLWVCCGLGSASPSRTPSWSFAGVWPYPPCSRGPPRAQRRGRRGCSGVSFGPPPPARCGPRRRGGAAAQPPASPPAVTPPAGAWCSPGRPAAPACARARSCHGVCPPPPTARRCHTAPHCGHRGSFPPPRPRLAGAPQPPARTCPPFSSRPPASSAPRPSAPGWSRCTPRAPRVERRRRRRPRGGGGGAAPPPAGSG